MYVNALNPVGTTATETQKTAEPSETAVPSPGV